MCYLFLYGGNAGKRDLGREIQTGLFYETRIIIKLEN